MRAFRLPRTAFRKFNRNKLFPPHMLISPRTTTLFHIDLSSLFRSILRRKHWFCVGVLFTASAAHGQWASGFYYDSPAGYTYGHPGTLTFTVSGNAWLDSGQSFQQSNFEPGTGPYYGVDFNGPTLTVASSYDCRIPPYYSYWTVTGQANDGAWYVSSSGVARGAWVCDNISNAGPAPVFHVVASAAPTPAPTPNPEATECDKKVGGGNDASCASCGSAGTGAAGMARYSVHAKLASLNVVDTPIRCITPHGPKIDFTATYNQRESQQPSTFHYSNLGPKWTFNWLSYVSDDPNNQLPVISVYVQGGGAEIYSYNLSTQTFDVQPRSHTLLVRANRQTIPVELHNVVGVTGGEGKD